MTHMWVITRYETHVLCVHPLHFYLKEWEVWTYLHRMNHSRPRNQPDGSSAELAELRCQLAIEKQTLADVRQELAEAHKQIFMLAKRPTRIGTVTMNVFGNENIDQIMSQLQNALTSTSPN